MKLSIPSSWSRAKLPPATLLLALALPGRARAEHHLRPAAGVGAEVTADAVPDGYEQTLGYCRSGPNWPGSHVQWSCRANMATSALCAAECDGDEHCGAFDFPAPGGRCCLFMAGNTGNGNPRNHCYVPGGVPASPPSYVLSDLDAAMCPDGSAQLSSEAECRAAAAAIAGYGFQRTSSWTTEPPGCWCNRNDNNWNYCYYNTNQDGAASPNRFLACADVGISFVSVGRGECRNQNIDEYASLRFDLNHPCCVGDVGPTYDLNECEELCADTAASADLILVGLEIPRSGRRECYCRFEGVLDCVATPPPSSRQKLANAPAFVAEARCWNPYKPGTGPATQRRDVFDRRLVRCYRNENYPFPTNYRPPARAEEEAKEE